MKKIASFILAFVLIFSMVPAVFAQTADVPVANIDFSNADAPAEAFDMLDWKGPYPCYYADGTNRGPVVTVTYDGEAFTEGVEYTLRYTELRGFGTDSVQPNVEGVYRISVDGRGEYSGQTFGFADYIIKGKPEYIVFFNMNDGTDKYESSGVVIWGNSLRDDQIPKFKRDGFDFAGWYLDEDCTDGNKFDTSAVIKGAGFAANRTLDVYAKWVEAEEELKVIDSVELTAPVIKDGDSYILNGDDQEPAPAVKTPANADYEVVATRWMEPLDSGSYTQGQGKEFKKGDKAYIGLLINPKEGSRFPVEEGVDDKHTVSIKINGGKEVFSMLLVSDTPEAPFADNSLIVVIEVDVQGDEAPKTGDSQNITLLTTMVASILVAAFFAVRSYQTRKER